MQQLRPDLDRQRAEPDDEASPLPAGEGEAALLALLAEAGQPVHVDELARTLARPVHEVTGTLALLEVQGRVRHAGGMQYTLAR